MKTETYQLKQGPMAGYTMTGETVALPDNYCMIELLFTPWAERPDRKAHRTTAHYSNYYNAEQALKRIEKTAKEMSTGPFIEPFTA